MPISPNFRKWITGIGAISGAVLLYPNETDNNEVTPKETPWIPTATPWTKWNHNWDRREPKCLINPSKLDNINDENKYNNELGKKTAKATRHIILVRHGQYNIKAQTQAEKTLTDLGKQQAEITGKRLDELGYPYTVLVHSTMVRAQQTANIITKSLKNVEVHHDSLLNEGAPIPPEPFVHWSPELNFYTDGPRIEAAFRKYFHRAAPSQEKDSYTILVCHANVIRYFVCRALQFPPQSWLRLSLSHASISWVTIYPDGIVTLWILGDTAHMMPQYIT